MTTFKYPILVSCHRSGSTWVQSYIRHAYQSNWKKTLSFSNTSNDDEFLNSWMFDKDKNFKINFLKILRDRGYELCHKIQAEMLFDKNILNWFIDFYKGHNIIILKRRDIWKSLISYVFHRTVRKKSSDIGGYTKHNIMPMHDIADSYANEFSKSQNIMPMHGHNSSLKTGENLKPTSKLNDILKSSIQSHNIKFKFDKELCEDYLQQVRYLNTIIEHKTKHLKPDIFYKEEISTKFLKKKFGAGTFTSPVIPLNVKYEVYYEPEELKKIKDFLQYHYENEFKFYGYEYKY